VVFEVENKVSGLAAKAGIPGNLIKAEGSTSKQVFFSMGCISSLLRWQLYQST
jgi:hypothetical protein